ncbi:hypothetical protein HMPREF1982_03408 [Clostridiales bacterium oral taxon 876 str. F0540]|nr:hypothetical protein HMPREF1982_03408 [Clostridiales bacterium oral taxon 876 str. F0540]
MKILLAECKSNVLFLKCKFALYCEVRNIYLIRLADKSELDGVIFMGIGIIVCGLNGSGKSTLGKALSEKLGFHFIVLKFKLNG